MKKVILQYSMICILFAFSSCNKDTINEDDHLAKIGQLVMVIQDSIPLRVEPNTSAKIAKYALTGLQLKILEISSDELWFKIKIGEDKGYQLNHSEEYWIENEDVYVEPKNRLSEITLDVSIFENEDLNNALRILDYDYLYKLKSQNLDTNYFVSGKQTIISPQSSCSEPFNICARTYKPDHYFFFENDLQHTDALTYEEQINRYNKLYENDTITPFYVINSNSKILSIHEKLICSKLIVDIPGCYPDKYIGTELELINDKTYNVNSFKFLSKYILNSDNIFKTKLNGGVQNLDLLYILDVKYDNNQSERIVRRINLSLVLCY